ncbi:SDR family NAD(P)-dependent oxidoreductase [Streptomyces sp. NPDC050523]|uniref:SDR family NAD(P)-dependent oxidoreductase n=1 Tax=Streptomyces sp. NPDC050523 TaxID=3365622 RepID=UPI0037B6D49D
MKVGVMTFDFTGKVALVIGGSTGIGETTAHAFRAAGALVVVADVNEQVGTKTVGSMGGADVAFFVKSDVSDSESVEALVRKVIERFGRLDIAFNNAGIQLAPAPLAEQNPANFAKVVTVNLRGVFNSMRAEIPAMLGSGGGSIINTASVMGERAAPGQSSYVASKHGIIGLTKGAAIDYATRGIRVNAILPGAVDSPMPQQITDVTQGRTENGMDTAPMRRLGTPHEVADAVLWLASDQSSFVTGASIAVDGGAIATL